MWSRRRLLTTMLGAALLLPGAVAPRRRPGRRDRSREAAQRHADSLRFSDVRDRLLVRMPNLVDHDIDAAIDVLRELRLGIIIDATESNGAWNPRLGLTTASDVSEIIGRFEEGEVPCHLHLNGLPRPDEDLLPILRGQGGRHNVPRSLFVLVDPHGFGLLSQFIAQVRLAETAAGISPIWWAWTTWWPFLSRHEPRLHPLVSAGTTAANGAPSTEYDIVRVTLSDLETELPAQFVADEVMAQVPIAPFDVHPRTLLFADLIDGNPRHADWEDLFDVARDHWDSLNLATLVTMAARFMPDAVPRQRARRSTNDLSDFIASVRAHDIHPAAIVTGARFSPATSLSLWYGAQYLRTLLHTAAMAVPSPSEPRPNPVALDLPGRIECAPQFIWPGSGPVTSVFAPDHPLGLDIAMPIGSPVVAAADGRVTFVGGDVCCSYGYFVGVKHSGDFSTTYAHLSRFAVSEGDDVRAGDLIGDSGSTGYSTGPHLHFEIRRGGIPQDPHVYLP